jgi:hypothetical protein
MRTGATKTPRWSCWLEGIREQVQQGGAEPCYIDEDAARLAVSQRR